MQYLRRLPNSESSAPHLLQGPRATVVYQSLHLYPCPSSSVGRSFQPLK